MVDKPTPLADPQVNALLRFIGYGNLSADVWFLGMEEAGATDEHLRIRSAFAPVEDCAEAHRKLGITKHQEGKRSIQKTWRGMCWVMLELAGYVPTTELIRTYQATQLGRPGSDSLLLELMPIPKPNTSSGWDYKQIMPQFASEQHYFETVLPTRMAQIKALISEHVPKVVVCYGKAYWDIYRSMFDNVIFVPDGPFLVSRASPSLIVLTPHFRVKEMNGQLPVLTEIIRSSRGLIND
jgi:hypothetical protein